MATAGDKQARLEQAKKLQKPRAPYIIFSAEVRDSIAATVQGTHGRG